MKYLIEGENIKEFKQELSVVISLVHGFLCIRLY
jgi:hypothetical protein